MTETLSDRRMAENQVIFRQENEKIQKGFDIIKQIAAEEGVEPILPDGDIPIYFYCECSDNNCRKRIKLPLNTYNEIHKARNRFVIVCGHEVPHIEDITATKEGYCVVTKHKMPPQSAEKLNVTEVDNV